MKKDTVTICFYFTIHRGGEREEDWKFLTEILFCWNRLDRQADTW